MIPVLYGIPNCDTVRKARAWMDANGRAYAFHDLRKDGLDGDTLAGWIAAHGWETVLNPRGTTFRALPATEREGLDADRATALMLARPAMVRRPILQVGARTVVGFDPDTWTEALNGA